MRDHRRNANNETAARDDTIPNALAERLQEHVPHWLGRMAEHEAWPGNTAKQLNGTIFESLEHFIP